MPIPGYEGLYEASSLGAVRSLERTAKQMNRWGQLIERPVPSRILRQRTCRNGYKRVNLSRNGVHETVGVHRAVCLAFFGKAPGLVAAHQDGNPANNRMENLRWSKPVENSHDKFRHFTDPRGERNPRAIVSENEAREIAQRLDKTAKQLSAEYGISKSQVLNIQHGRSWSLHGVRPEPKAIHERIRTAKAILTWDQVRQIRQSVGLTHKELAEMYGTTRSNIGHILSCKSWRE